MRAILVSAVCGLMMALTGCSGQVSGTARGLFIGYVTDKTEEEVVAKVGKPDSTAAATPTTLRWTYKKKTFDPDNQSRVDDETILIFQKDASGKFKVVQVIFG
jgi:type IV secretory pathway TrbF-like protein